MIIMPWLELLGDKVVHKKAKMQVDTMAARQLKELKMQERENEKENSEDEEAENKYGTVHICIFMTLGQRRMEIIWKKISFMKMMKLMIIIWIMWMMMKVAMTTMEAKMNIHIKCFSEMCFVFLIETNN